MSEKILSPQLPELSDQGVFDLILDCHAKGDTPRLMAAIKYYGPSRFICDYILHLTEDCRTPAAYAKARETFLIFCTKYFEVRGSY
ncbi:MAG TPA: hypothetical protein PL124_08980 [Candidatus Cloacimonadota bacterium]|nr:hypothetical protein [Candidatus Cloacimonadota bacterium]HPS39530.1 hypothetical protein [Candidatus Cloacimonadota bacterium]